MYSIKIYVPWFENSFLKMQSGKLEKKEVGAGRVMEWILITPLMPDSLFGTNVNMPRCFYQHHDLPFNGVCDLQANSGHFLKDAAEPLLSILNCSPRENFGTTLSHSNLFSYYRAFEKVAYTSF